MMDAVGLARTPNLPCELLHLAEAGRAIRGNVEHLEQRAIRSGVLRQHAPGVGGRNHEALPGVLQHGDIVEHLAELQAAVPSARERDRFGAAVSEEQEVAEILDCQPLQDSRPLRQARAG